jgi:hypothetical protein
MFLNLDIIYAREQGYDMQGIKFTVKNILFSNCVAMAEYCIMPMN